MYVLENAANGARYIIGSAENTEFGRSKTITNLHFSEAAFYKHFEKLLAGAGTALVPDGKFVIETTANGFNQFKTFYNESELGLTDFTAHFYPSQDFYPAEFLEKEKKRLGRLFDQEHPSSPEIAFITSGETYFDVLAMRWYMENTREVMAV